MRAPGPFQEFAPDRLSANWLTSASIAAEMTTTPAHLRGRPRRRRGRKMHCRSPRPIPPLFRTPMPTHRLRPTSSCSRRAAPPAPPAPRCAPAARPAAPATIGSINATCAIDSLIPAPRLLLRGNRQPPLQAIEIGQHQLGIDGFGIADRIDAALDMRDHPCPRSTCRIWTITSTSRIFARNWLPSPSPLGRPAAPAQRYPLNSRLVGRDLRRLANCRPATLAARSRAPAPRARRSARSCRTDSSPPARRRSPSAR